MIRRTKYLNILAGFISALTCCCSASFAQSAVGKKPSTQAVLDTILLKKYYAIANENEGVDNPLALKYILLAEQLVAPHKQASLRPKVYNLLGIIYDEISKDVLSTDIKAKYLAKSQTYLRFARSEARRLGNEEYYVKAWYNQINYEYYAVHDYVQRAYDLLSYIQKKNKYAHVDSMISLKLYKDLAVVNDFNIESKLYKSLMESYERLLPALPSQQYTYYSLRFEAATNTSLVSKKDSILSLYKHYIAKIEASDRKYIKIELGLYLVKYLVNIGDIALAYKTISQVREEIHKLDYHATFVQYHLSMLDYHEARILTSQKRYRPAIELLQKAEVYFSGVGKREIAERYDLYSLQAYLYEAVGDINKAYAYQKKQHEVYKEMQNQQFHILTIGKEYEIKSLEFKRQIQQAETKTLLKEQEIKVINSQRNILIVISIIAFLSFIWALNNFSKSKRLSQELKTKNTLIHRQANALEDSNKLKDKIFALLSHDLRALVNRLLTNFRASNIAEYPEFYMDLKVLQDILNNVLYWANLQLKGIQPIYTDVPLYHLCEGLIQEYRQNLLDKRIKVINNIDHKQHIVTDENFLKIILRNVLNNAIKFTPEDGFIRIEERVDNDTLEIRIRDTGGGIAKEVLDHIFSFPTPAMGTSHEKGTGLGLTLSREIASKIDALLSISSKPGQGTTVSIRLPIRRGNTSPKPIATVEQVKIS